MNSRREDKEVSRMLDIPRAPSQRVLEKLVSRRKGSHEKKRSSEENGPTSTDTAFSERNGKNLEY